MSHLDLNVDVYQEGEYWIAKCRELDILASGPSKQRCIEDIRPVAEAQVLFGMKHAEDFIRLAFHEQE